MGYLCEDKMFIEDFNIEIKKNKANMDNIFLTIKTSTDILKYRIAPDDRHPIIKEIFTDLNNGLNYVKNNENAIITISEYPERMYLFVTYPNGDMKQYTGEKIK